ncbi:venom allergen 5 [Procambarus clarkii]|uniref:venom allergen 5 n=1 Tax=Procambarus clarkii TaxID=6728 RepID=UPI001E6710E4|nr:venom allergen 5-like [Procambarus clarkii]
MSGARRAVLVPVVLLGTLLTTVLEPVTCCEYRAVDPRHTMCTFLPRQCTGKTILRSGGLTCQDKETILDSHNTLRQKVSMGHVRNQPPALNMRALVWDEELATVAQRWADQCMPGHDRARNLARFTVGQNVAAAWTYERDEGDTPDFNTQVEAWFNEVNQYGFSKSSVDPFRFNKATGHYTQMVWAETYLVGCGYTYYKDPSLGYTKIYVCNYAPGGNVIGGSMYKLGFPGQQYCVSDGLHPSAAYQGLCDREAGNKPGPCGKMPSSAMHHPSLTNSISSSGPHPSMMSHAAPHMMMPHPAPHHPMTPHDYMDDHDIMRPGEFLMKGIQEPFKGIMKILNPWNILNRFT